MLLERLRVWHIDQQYKSFQNDYFTVVHSKLDILVGYRDHVSGCVHRHATADKMMGSSFIPQPGVSYQRKAKIKVQRPDSAAPFIISSLRKSSQPNVKQLNADCRPLDTAICIIFDSCRGDCESLLSFIYDFLLAACIWLSAVVGRCPKKTRSLIFTGLSAGTTNPKRIALPGVRRNTVPLRPPRSRFLGCY